MDSIVIRNISEINPNVLTDKMLMESVIVYCRVSTKHQIEGNSLNIQQKNGENFYNSDLFNYPFKHIIVFREEGKSGDDFKVGDTDFVERELLSYILTKIEEKCIKYLWVENSDRLSRCSTSSDLIKKRIVEYDVKFYILNQICDLESLETNLMLTILSVFDQYENHKRFRKSLFGKIESVKRGKWYGGKRPYGLMKGDTVGSHKINKTESKVIRQIFDLFGNKEYTIKNILVWLDNNNVKPPISNSWNNTTVRNILGSEVYIGRITYEIKLLKNKTKDECRELGKTELITQTNLPKIINKNLFNKVQIRLSQLESRVKVNSKMKYDYLLWDLLYCDCCGNRMKIKRNLKKGINIYWCDYKSKNWKYSNDSIVTKCGKDKMRSINISVTETIVWNEFLNVFKNSHIIKEQYKNEVLPLKIKQREQPQNSINEMKKDIDVLVDKIDTLNNRRNDCYRKYSLDEINENLYNTIIRDIDSKIKECNTKIEYLKSEITKIQSGINWYDWVSDFEKLYSEMKSVKTIDEKRKYLKKYVEKVTVSYCFITKVHTLKLLFKVKIVDDKRRRLGKYQFKVTNGKNDKVISNINSNSLSKRIKQNLSTQTIIQNHSTVTDYFCNIVEKSENGFQNKDKEIIISFTLSIKKGDLINVNNYNNYQQKLYDLIKKYKEVDKISYNRIRDILFEKGYRSVRTNKVLKSNYIWSIYKKGMIREKRMKIFNSKYSHIKLNIKHL